METNKNIEELLSLFSFEEILEQNDLTEEEVVYILYKRGFVMLPPFLENYKEEEDDVKSVDMGWGEQYSD